MLDQLLNDRSERAVHRHRSTGALTLSIAHSIYHRPEDYLRPLTVLFRSRLGPPNRPIARSTADHTRLPEATLHRDISRANGQRLTHRPKRCFLPAALTRRLA